MRFGHRQPNIMNNKIKGLFLAGALLAFGCNHKSSDSAADFSISPEAGTTYKAGDEVKLKVGFPADAKVDSVVYLLASTNIKMGADSVYLPVATKIGVTKDTSGISLKTDTLPLGIRVVTAKIYAGGKSQDVTTNILLLAAKAPEHYTYKVEKVFPHDTSAYTEGLQYEDGHFYESIGDYKRSALRKFDLNTGKTLLKIKLDDQYFGEGISVVGDKIIQLTYREKVAFVYDKNTFKLIKTFPNNLGPEGWGMCFDGNKLYNDDSTNRIWFRDKDTYRPTGFIDVCDNTGQIDSINELEYIDGKLYANIYQKDTILVINPKTGAVEQLIDMKDLYPMADRPQDRDWDNNVLNGIAWDAKGKRLFVTGKKWPQLYQVKFVKAP
jgi:glutamine cyclotransferase